LSLLPEANSLGFSSVRGDVSTLQFVHHPRFSRGHEEYSDTPPLEEAFAGTTVTKTKVSLQRHQKGEIEGSRVKFCRFCLNGLWRFSRSDRAQHPGMNDLIGTLPMVLSPAGQTPVTPAARSAPAVMPTLPARTNPERQTGLAAKPCRVGLCTFVGSSRHPAVPTF
jgi:hypothetical protein